MDVHVIGKTVVIHHKGEVIHVHLDRKFGYLVSVNDTRKDCKVQLIK